MKKIQTINNNFYFILFSVFFSIFRTIFPSFRVKHFFFRGFNLSSKLLCYHTVLNVVVGFFRLTNYTYIPYTVFKYFVRISLFLSVEANDNLRLLICLKDNKQLYTLVNLCADPAEVPFRV